MMLRTETEADFQSDHLFCDGELHTLSAAWKPEEAARRGGMSRAMHGLPREC